MAKFSCKKCGYRFELDTEKIPKICPYCGKEKTVESQKSADELLNELNLNAE